MAIKRVLLMVTIGKFAGAIANDGRAAQITDCFVALPGKWPAHECASQRAHFGHFADMSMFVDFAERRFHVDLCFVHYLMIFIDLIILLIEFTLSHAFLLSLPPGAGGCSMTAETKIAGCTLDFFEGINAAT